MARRNQKKPSSPRISRIIPIISHREVAFLVPADVAVVAVVVGVVVGVVEGLDDSLELEEELPLLLVPLPVDAFPDEPVLDAAAQPAFCVPP